jgi:NTP pyrophosphatase (non-canonical NTP hydrolase)
MIESAKGYARDYNYVFRHLISEIGELEAAIWNYEKNSNHKNDNRKKIGFELLDIVFLACYMAEIFGVNLNDVTEERMDDIRKQYLFSELKIGD